MLHQGMSMDVEKKNVAMPFPINKKKGFLGGESNHKGEAFFFYFFSCIIFHLYIPHIMHDLDLE
jgi:hypothetical protein